MSDRMKTISLRRFRERAAEITEPVDIAIRDRDGNFQIIGFFTPYVTHPPEATPLKPLDLGGPVIEEAPDRTGKGPIMVATPEEAATAVRPVRPFPKSAQTGRRKR